MAEPSALELALEYHRAWTTGRMAAAAECLANDVSVEVPINEYPTKASFLDAVDRTRRMTSRLDVLTALGGDRDAVLVYDMVLPFGSMRVAEHLTVADGSIVRIRQIHDTHALRLAMAQGAPADTARASG